MPYWLTGEGIDELADEETFSQFDKVRQEFMQIFEEEERRITAEHDILISGVMQDMWDSKGVWFWYCIKSVNAMFALVSDHIAPRYSTRLVVKVEEIVSKFWCEDSEAFVAQKVADEKRYDQELRRLFGEPAAVEALTEAAVERSDRAQVEAPVKAPNEAAMKEATVETPNGATVEGPDRAPDEVAIEA